MLSNDCVLHFIRHAETTFNQANQAFKMSHRDHYEMSFDKLSTIPDFRNGVRFNPSHIDCSITEKGKKECLLAKNQFEMSGIIPDLVLVSPFNRTLETCHQIFGLYPSFPIIAEPLVGEILKSACDISHPLDSKTMRYSGYNFEQCVALGNRWDLLKNSQSHLNHYKHILENKDLNSQEERISHIIELMNVHNKVETQEDLLQRSLRFIKKLEEVYAPQYQNIVIVTHFMFLDCVSAFSYHPDFTPADGIKAKNCQLYSIKFSKLFEKFVHYQS